METIKDDEVALYADFDNRQRVKSLASGRHPVRTLPVIDFGAYAEDRDIEARRRVARALREACTDTGFFYLVGHGISAAEFDLAHDWGHLFFELPPAERAKCGWRPVAAKNPANPDKEIDQKEAYALPRPLLPGEVDDQPHDARGRGTWPAPEIMPGFRDFAEAHTVKRIRVAQRLCRALALSLDLPEDYLDAPHRFPAGSLCYNYYPALDPTTVGWKQWGISPHTDYGSFTLLSQDELGGLEVRAASGEWIEVPPMRGALVVNLADLFVRWTNGRYVSSLHRASNFRADGRARISLPLFFIPHYWARVECLPTCQGPGNPAKYDPVQAGPYVRTLIEQSYRIGRPGLMKTTGEERMERR